MDTNASDEPMISIGAMSVPEWQFDIYVAESLKFMNFLKEETVQAKNAPISKNLIRAIHTLSGITNTLGFDIVAKIGLPFEAWLTHFYENDPDNVIANEHYLLLEKTSSIVVYLVEHIRTKQYPSIDYANELAQIQAFLDGYSGASHSSSSSQDSEDTDTPNIALDELTEPLTHIQDTNAQDSALSDLITFENDDLGSFDDLDSLLGTLTDTEATPTFNAEKSEFDTAATTSGSSSNKLSADKNQTSSHTSTSTTSAVTSSHDHTRQVMKSTPPVHQPKSAPNSFGASSIQSILPTLLPTDDVADDVDDSIKDIFLEEAVDIFDTLPGIIDKWIESSGEDGESANLIKRALHTLKGSSRMAGYIRFGVLVHNIETAIEVGLDGLDKQDLPELVQLTCDALAQEVQHYQNASSASGFDQLKKYRNAAVTTVAVESAAKTIAAENEIDMRPVSATSDTLDTARPLEALDTHVSDNTQNINPDTTSVSNRFPSGYKGMSSTNTDNASDEDGVAGVLRVPTTKVDTLSTHLGKSGMIQLRVESSVESVEEHIDEMSLNLERLRRLLKDVEIQAETQMKSKMSEAQKTGAKFDPLEFDRFTRLQELTRMTAEAMNDINNSQSEIVRGLSHIQDSMAENAIVADDMQHAVMSVRTVPASSMKRRLDRLVRQACRDTNKKTDLELISDSEIDSGVLNRVVTPLEHLARNAIAHGIEAPSKRIDLGKPESGMLRLTVKMRGNDIVFSMSDDGAGINRLNVQKQARLRGIVGPDEEITQERANALIFDPGFSTAEKISEISGRGVGMDIVQSEIAAMGGRINVHSEDGVGTTFELVVPSYMAVISMVPVKANDIEYAVPATLVQDVVVIRDHLILTAYENGVIEYLGQSYPFYGLSEVSGGGPNEIQRNNRVLLVNDTTSSAAVHIDALEADRNLVMKPLCRSIATLPGLMGSTVAGDGTPLLVINPVQLRQSVQRTDKKRQVKEVVVNKVKTRADTVVMVVDDSLTVRRITQKFLDREGFKTIVAKDGLDAIEKITEHGCPDIFICDIEMPNMDGFQLVEHIRTAVSKTVPIIMISSRSIDKYSDHAASLGVNRSMGKPYQEPELLASIEEFTGLVT